MNGSAKCLKTEELKKPVRLFQARSLCFYTELFKNACFTAHSSFVNFAKHFLFNIFSFLRYTICLCNKNVFSEPISRKKCEVSKESLLSQNRSCSLNDIVLFAKSKIPTGSIIEPGLHGKKVLVLK